jgi:hypothetical protein
MLEAIVIFIIVFGVGMLATKKRNKIRLYLQSPFAGVGQLSF